jgi:hypothetical protein
MKFLKRSSLNARRVKDTSVAAFENGIVEIGTPAALLLPKGVIGDRPLVPINGYIRYNTTTQEAEIYVNSTWRKIAYKEPTAIVQQDLGNGDDIETYFGPLNSGNGDFPFPDLSAPQNIMVYIENVYQISTTNYILEDNPPGKDPGRYIKFDSPVPTGKPVTVIHGFDR